MAALGDDLLRVVNQLQDLVFNTIGSDSLDLPQIVCHALPRLRRSSHGFAYCQLFCTHVSPSPIRLLSDLSRPVNLLCSKTLLAETFFREGVAL